MATPAEIEDFMHGPLVTWLRSCLENPEKLHDYEDLVDGPLVHEVYLLIDPEPLYHGVVPSVRNVAQRIKNMSFIVKNIKALYKEEFGQIVVALPDVIRLGREPESKGGLEDMQLLLLLLIGCAVQGPNKEKFIEAIQTMPPDTQMGLVACISKVTETQEIVISDEEVLKSEGLLISHIKKLADDRDRYLTLWSEHDESRHSSSLAANSSMSNALDLAECKALMRKQRLELDEKTEKMLELKADLEKHTATIAKLKARERELTQQARELKAYRDEVDALREKAEKCNRLENDVTNYRDKLIDLQYLKDRVEGTLKENRILEEKIELLEDQLDKARKKCDKTLELERTNIKMHQKINELDLELEAQAEKIHQLQDENVQLTLLYKSNLINSSSSNNMDDSDIFPGTLDNSLSEQLTNTAQTRALELDLENRRLLTEIESLQESLRGQTNEKILELEKEKKRLSLQVDSLESSKKKLAQTNSEYEKSLNEYKLEIKKTHESKELLRNQLLARSKEIDDLNNERQKLERKIEELEQSLELVRQQADSITEVQELKHKISSLEKNVLKLRETNEEQAVEMDKLISEAEVNLREKTQFKKQVEELQQQLTRLHEVEQEYRELKSKYNIDKQTLATLQQDLVNEKMDRQRMAENTVDSNVTNLSNAKLEVSIKTLQTQITSLKAEHLALQLANSQLAAEKEEISKECERLKENHERLSKDQLSLQKLHEQLTADNDELLEALQTAKNSINDYRTDNRNLEDEVAALKCTQQILQAEKETLGLESKSLTNLRHEHSNLKEDFRHLYAINEKTKADYQRLQDKLTLYTADNGKLRLSLTELEGQVASFKDIITSLEVEKTKLKNKCEVLIQSNEGLEVDKRTLMEHVSLILGQYNDLLNHSLEDKEHHHSEEKQYADKVNNLRRQKEKLEEKIMENYRQMNSVSSNKNRKSFTGLVRSIRKVGSDLINKSRKSAHDDGAKRGTDSDTSLEDVRSRQGDTLSCLGTPGTRRAVYYSADENNSGSNEPDDSTKPSKNENDNQRTDTPQQDQGLFVYNHVSVINQSPSHSPNLSQQNSKKSSPAEDKNSPLWYEYGCV
nr:PREDICTED: daple-like protein isoform X1 [Bemisia tabaci]XP_018904929.1 PREDICTED: daple-like protein isoform X1 [Bemisia tabaci]